MKFIFLAQDFFDAYADCYEIEQKRDRPFVQVCIRIDGVTFAIPLRSNINHKYVLWTDEPNKCGLDFTKTVVLSKGNYIDESRKPHIRQNEFDALRGKEYIVKKKLEQYIHIYKKAKKRIDVPRNRTLCEFSTLQYFEDFL